jgi:sec-independent protein translocase protein TatA
MNIQLLAFIQNLRAPELILIFLVVLLLFGAKRLPELFKSFGKSIKEFTSKMMFVAQWTPKMNQHIAHGQKANKSKPAPQPPKLQRATTLRVKKKTHNYDTL